MNERVRKIEADDEEFLRDESRRVGTAESISFPRTEAEVCEILSAMYEAGTTVTVQGARTGIAGGASPDGGHIMNVSRMESVLGLRADPDSDNFFLRVQPGVLLQTVKEGLAAREFETEGWSEESLAALEVLKSRGLHFFAPDLTEITASIGGLVACNGSGARTFHYGATRESIQSLRVVLADGRVLTMERGCPKAEGRHFEIRAEGEPVVGDLPDYAMPDVKNAAGFFAADDMDMMDLFIGCEGTLGVVTEAELVIQPEPATVWAMAAFFPDEAGALRFVRGVRGEAIEGFDGEIERKPVAIEFFNHDALDLLRGQKETNPAFAEIPDMEEGWHTAVFVEYHGDDEDVVGEAMMTASEIMVACGGDEDATWLADDLRERERLRFFRHATPEAVNLLIDNRRQKEPKLTKLGTDMAVPDEHLEAVFEMYNTSLAESGLDSVIFGHIGNNHVHVNILPNTLAEYDRGKALYLEWADKIIAMGGTVSAEHGVGKLKVAFLKRMYGEEGIAAMRRVKEAFDPKRILGKGNLFEA